MKKVILTITLVSLLTLSMTGCWGSFQLTKNLYHWNDGHGDKWISTIVMWAIYVVPVVAAVCAFVDIAILNLVEFWTGSNPLAMNEGEIETKIYVHQGKEYEITVTKNRYDITEIDNPDNSIAYVFSPEESAWYLHSNDQISKITETQGEITKFFDLDGNVLVTR